MGSPLNPTHYFILFIYIFLNCDSTNNSKTTFMLCLKLRRFVCFTFKKEITNGFLGSTLPPFTPLLTFFHTLMSCYWDSLCWQQWTKVSFQFFNCYATSLYFNFFFLTPPVAPPPLYFIWFVVRCSDEFFNLC